MEVNQVKPKQSNAFPVRLGPAERAKLSRLAKKHELSMSAMVKKLILDQEEPGEI